MGADGGEGGKQEGVGGSKGSREVALPANRPATMRHDAYDVLQVPKSWLTWNETKNAVEKLRR